MLLFQVKILHIPFKLYFSFLFKKIISNFIIEKNIEFYSNYRKFIEQNIRLGFIFIYLTSCNSTNNLQPHSYPYDVKHSNSVLETVYLVNKICNSELIGLKIYNSISIGYKPQILLIDQPQIF